MAAKITYHSPEAEAAANSIIRAFEDPSSLPAKLAPVVLAAGGRHCDAYSWRNQLLVALAGYSDAAGYKQWRFDYGRQVQKGERAMFILRPIKRSFTVTEPDPATGQDRERRVSYVAGFTDVKVFGLEQTEICDQAKWDAHAAKAKESQAKIEAAPFFEVAARWGLEVRADGHLYARGAQGFYRPSTKEIRLAVENLSTWAHELVHFVDDKLGNMTTRWGQQPDNEVVAELGGAVCLTAMGLKGDADLGGCWDYVSHYSDGDPIKACTTLLGRTLDAVSTILRALEDPTAPAPWDAPDAPQAVDEA